MSVWSKFVYNIMHEKIDLKLSNKLTKLVKHVHTLDVSYVRSC